MKLTEESEGGEEDSEDGKPGKWRTKNVRKEKIRGATEEKLKKWCTIIEKKKEKKKWRKKNLIDSFEKILYTLPYYLLWSEASQEYQRIWYKVKRGKIQCRQRLRVIWFAHL